MGTAFSALRSLLDVLFRPLVTELTFPSARVAVDFWRPTPEYPKGYSYVKVEVGTGHVNGMAVHLPDDRHGHSPHVTVVEVHGDARPMQAAPVPATVQVFAQSWCGGVEMPQVVVRSPEDWGALAERAATFGPVERVKAGTGQLAHISIKALPHGVRFIATQWSYRAGRPRPLPSPCSATPCALMRR